MIRALCMLLITAALATLTASLIAMSEPVDAMPAPPAPVATGPLTYRQGTYTLRLTERACPFPELVQVLEDEGVPPALVYEVQEMGRASAGCYAFDIQGDVMTLDLGGQEGMLPIGWFRRDPGV